MPYSIAFSAGEVEWQRTHQLMYQCIVLVVMWWCLHYVVMFISGCGPLRFVHMCGGGEGTCI